MNTLEAEADVVVSAFLAVRDSGCVLSVADAALLAGWLEGGIGADVIVHAIHTTMEQRNASRRQRRPLTLLACARAVRARVKLLGPDAGFRAKPRRRDAGPELVNIAVPADLQELVRATRAEIAALVESAAEDRADQVCATLRIFHARAWDLVVDEHAELFAAAAEEIANLRELLSVEDFRLSVEEIARNSVRHRWRDLTTSRVLADMGLLDEG